VNPLYKWIGGKRHEIKYFKSFYPEKFTKYIEPFFGAGATFFDLAFTDNVINDIHPDNINFLNEIKIGNGKKIYELMQKYPNNKEIYYKVRDEFKPKNKTEEAFQFYYLRKTCFRGMIRYNSNGKFNVSYGKYKNINYDELLFPQYEQLLQKTHIMSTDFTNVFSEYNDENYFMFLDPPYDSTFTNYGYCNFGRKQHEKLFELFSTTKNKCLLVIASTDFIHNLYKDYIVGTYSKKYAFKIYSGRIGSEINKEHLIIRNYSNKGELKNRFFDL